MSVWSKTPHHPLRFGWLCASLFLALGLCVKPAHAWIETTVAADDITVQMDKKGAAIVEHALTLSVRGGPLRTLDVPGVDPDAMVLENATVTAMREGNAHGNPGTLSVSVQPDHTLRLRIDDAKGLSRGTYLLRFRYRTDLAKTGALERAGVMLRVRWAGPKWPNGLDTSHCTFAVPSAPTEPRALAEDRDAATTGEAGDPSARTLSNDDMAGSLLTALHRLPDHDELELTRAHIARGERAVWGVRIDPQALSDLVDLRLRPSASAAVREAMGASGQERQTLGAVALGLAFLFTALTAIKDRQVALAAARARTTMRPLVQLPMSVRPWLVGALVSVGVGLELWFDSPVWGALVLVLVMITFLYRTPVARPMARAPGRWLPLTESEAFHKPQDKAPNTWLDVSTWSGAIAFAICLLAMSAVTFATYRVSPYHAWLVALDGVVFVALFATGCSSHMPLSMAIAPARRLRRIARTLKRLEPSLRVVPWARFAQGSTEHDELRLRVMPKVPLRGLTSIEIACSLIQGPGGPVIGREVFVRVAEETPAEQQARSLAPLGRWVNGRRAGERVLCLEPRLPTWRMTAALALRVSHALTEQVALSSPRALEANAKGYGSNSAASSAGSSARAAKGATAASPLQATETAWSA